MADETIEDVLARLNQQRVLFVYAYVESGNASQSAIKAGYSKKTARQQGQRLLTIADIALAIEILMVHHQERHEVTVDSLTTEYEEARALALKEGQASAMVSATNGKGKLHGLLKDKAEIDLNHHHEVALAELA